MQNDKINLKQLLPFEKKLFMKLNEKIDDMKIKIENATLHMSRPWENDNENENEDENEKGNENVGGDEGGDGDKVISLKSHSVDFVQSLDHDNSWIVTNSNSNSNSNSSSNSKMKMKNKNKNKNEMNEDDDIQVIESSQLSQLSDQVNVITDRARFFRRSIDRINDAVGMLEVGSDWMDSRKYSNSANDATLVNNEINDGNENSHDNDNKSDERVSLNDGRSYREINLNNDNNKKDNHDNSNTSNKQKISHNEKHEKSIKTVKSGRWKDMGTFANINNENFLNAKLNELEIEIEQEQDEDWLLIDGEHSFQEHSPTQKSSSKKCSLLALFDKMELTKSSYNPKNINSRKSGIKVLSPLAMIGMNVSESEKKKKNRDENDNDNDNENVTDDDMVGTLLGCASSPEGETAALHSFTSPSPSSSSSSSLSHPHIHTHTHAHTHFQPSSIPLHHQQQQQHQQQHTSASASRHNEYHMMKDRKSISDDRRRRQNVWIQFSNTTSKSDAVVTTVSPLILHIKNSKNITKNLENVVKSSANNEKEKKNENEEGEGEGGNTWYHILPHTNPHHHHQYCMSEDPQMLLPTQPSRTSTNTNIDPYSGSSSSGDDSRGKGVDGGVGFGGILSGTKFSNLFQGTKNKTNSIPILHVDTSKPDNKVTNKNDKKNEVSRFELKDTSIFGKNVIDGSTSASSRVDDVRDSDNSSRRKSSFGSRDGSDGTESVSLPSPLPSSTSTSTSLFSSPLDSHSPSSSLSSPQLQHQQQQRSSIGTPSLMIDGKEKESNDEKNKNKLLISPDIYSKKSPTTNTLKTTVTTVNPTVNPVTPAPALSFLEQVNGFYLKHNPTKVEEIPKLLEKYRGQENELIRKLEKKYGVISGLSSTGDTSTGTGTGTGTVMGIGREGNSTPVQKSST